MDTACLDVAAFTFPNSIAQTRDYVEATRAMAPDNNSDFRFQLWETTLESDGANDFNLRYTSRWSEAADPTGWAAYHAVKILLETVLAVWTTDSDAIIPYLESPETTFDLLKGPGTSFRPWNHQLRQPLYVVPVGQDAEWIRSQLAARIGIVRYEATLPAYGGPDATSLLDQFGEGVDNSSCNF